MRTPASGDQYELTSGGARAVVSSVGASLRELRVDGRDLVVGFAADEVRPMHRGAALAPWVNRVVGGAYEFGGVRRQLALSEPARGHAIHGLVSWQQFEPREHGRDRLVLAAVVQPSAGYPWRVEVEVAFALDADGLTQTVTGRNLGGADAPWGCGAHPYLVAGAGRVDDWSLHLGAERVLLVDDAMVPVRLAASDAVAPAGLGGDRPVRIGAARIDHAFTALRRDPAGSAAVEVLDGGGAGVRLVLDAACGWVQVYTADRPGGAADPAHRGGLAVEPMTCAPDAFNSGEGLVVLAPGEAAAASWRIEIVRPC